MQFVKMTVGGIALDQMITPPFFVLKDEQRKRSFPIPVSDNTASVSTPTGTFLQGENPYASLLTSLIEQGEMKVKEIKILEDKKSALIGQISLSSPRKKDFFITVTPGEAVVMAVLYSLSVSLEDSLMLNADYFHSKAIATHPLRALESLLPHSLTDAQSAEISQKPKKDKVQ